MGREAHTKTPKGSQKEFFQPVKYIFSATDTVIEEAANNDGRKVGGSQIQGASNETPEKVELWTKWIHERSLSEKGQDGWKKSQKICHDYAAAGVRPELGLNPI